MPIHWSQILKSTFCYFLGSSFIPVASYYFSFKKAVQSDNVSSNCIDLSYTDLICNSLLQRVFWSTVVSSIIFLLLFSTIFVFVVKPFDGYGLLFRELVLHCDSQHPVGFLADGRSNELLWSSTSHGRWKWAAIGGVAGQPIPEKANPSAYNGPVGNAVTLMVAATPLFLILWLSDRHLFSLCRIMIYKDSNSSWKCDELCVDKSLIQMTFN